MRSPDKNVLRCTKCDRVAGRLEGYDATKLTFHCTHCTTFEFCNWCGAALTDPLEKKMGICSKHSYDPMG